MVGRPCNVLQRGIALRRYKWAGIKEPDTEVRFFFSVSQAATKVAGYVITAWLL